MAATKLGAEQLLAEAQAHREEAEQWRAEVGSLEEELAELQGAAGEAEEEISQQAARTLAVQRQLVEQQHLAEASIQRLQTQVVGLLASAEDRSFQAMRRCGIRMLRRELSDTVLSWAHAYHAAARRIRAEAIFQRAGGHIRNREASMLWRELQANFAAHQAAGAMRERLRIAEATSEKAFRAMKRCANRPHNLPPPRLPPSIFSSVAWWA